MRMISFKFFEIMDNSFSQSAILEQTQTIHTENKDVVLSIVANQDLVYFGVDCGDIQVILKIILLLLSIFYLF